MEKREAFFVGIDVGSVSANTVVLRGNKEILEEHYTRTYGQPLKTAYNLLKDIYSRYRHDEVAGLTFTGTAGKLISKLLKVDFQNEIIAQSKAIEYLHPEVKTVIEMGGEDSKLIMLTFDPATGKTAIADFSMNSVCAAGTGSFLDQQAHRLGLTIEEFGELALKSKHPPRIAGRCSVFAKTDMIHLQQIATADYDIVAGLCFAVARNFKSTIAKGRDLKKPVAFQGGVAASAGMRKAFCGVLGLGEGELIVPEHFASMGAIGAAILFMENEELRGSFKELPSIETLEEVPFEAHEKTEPLKPPKEHLSQRSRLTAVSSTAHGRVDAYLGIDVGSISTNLVVIDERSEVLSSRYLMTAGRPIEAIKRGLKEIGDEIADSVVIKGVGTTGSGRYLTGDFVGADVIKNEITAQATAATHIDPDVDTIFEIGGQDSKYISLKDGAIVDFEMNKVCAAGTGSFLEEQAEKLGISIKEEFGDLALKAPQPVPLGERCTVFIESDLVHHQQLGASRENLVAGLSCSIVLNYLNKVVGDRRIGERIFFQGGTAFNVGVVAAFEKLLDRTVAVPENHHVTGAIGAAIVAMRERAGEESRFKGFDLSRRSYELTSFECRGCPNMCEIRKLTVEGEKPLYYGGRCEKYEVRERTLKDTIPNLFTEREELLERTWGETEPPSPGAPEIGIPRTMFFHELLPLFRTFFEALGFRVVLSDKTHKGIIHRGIEAVLSEACFPIKVGHGHILNLIEKGVKTIFLPSVIEMPLKDDRVERNFTCPYIQALPYTVRSAINFGREGVRLLNPVLNFKQDQRQLAKAFRRLGKELGKSPRQVTKALKAAVHAQNAFYESCRRRGREILENLGPDEMAMVVISRPYNGCDSGINLNLPQKVIDLGVIPIPLDFVPEDEAQPSRDSLFMYWSYGRRILAVAQLLRRDPRLRAIYLTNFGCGPDSFISHFFKEELEGSPHLIIEIDEHSADVGMITRLEAFLDSLKGAGKQKAQPIKVRRLRASHNGLRTIYLSYMTDHAFPLAAAFEACGKPAQVLPESDQETLKWGRKLTSGRECYPCILTTGDMAKKAKSPDFDPERSAFFMPGGRGPCRFGQYHRFHRLVLDELGFEGVPILAPIQDDGLCNELGAMGNNFMRIAWEGVVAADLFEKKARETRPYERHPGETDRMYRHFLEEVCETTRKRGNILGVLKRAREAFDGIEKMGEAKPIIGIVGEIYIRSNRFSNEDIVGSLEQLGVEVWLPPIGEWILYTNYTAKRHSLVKGDYRNLIRNVVADRMQQAIEHRMEAVFKGSLKNTPEPTTKEVITKALPYLHPSFEGEAILSMGKAVDFEEKGVCGIINTMPFTCMPGTIVTALLKRFREDHDDIPVLSMSYDGQKETNALTRLEAFVHQVRQRHRDA